eukprot:GHVS01078968.1.p2 GENE.GHVS01078968.1~~GHVS01078968.1.p2  ORF type:complete len:767 (+),score=171.27 GHVS01078968.1:140-2440(+)
MSLKGTIQEISNNPSTVTISQTLNTHRSSSPAFAVPPESPVCSPLASPPLDEACSSTPVCCPDLSSASLSSSSSHPPPARCSSSNEIVENTEGGQMNGVAMGSDGQQVDDHQGGETTTKEGSSYIPISNEQDEGIGREPYLGWGAAKRHHGMKDGAGKGRVSGADPPPTSGTASVPYRLLLPHHSVGFVVGKSGTTVRDIQTESGASIQFEKESTRGGALADKIVTVDGSVAAKDKAVELILQKLRGLARLHDIDGKEAIVIVVPHRAVPMLIGPNGHHIRELCMQSQCELQIHREQVYQPAECAISVRSTDLHNLVVGVSCVNKALSDMVDKQKLGEADFMPSPSVQRRGSGVVGIGGGGPAVVGVVPSYERGGGRVPTTGGMNLLRHAYGSKLSGVCLKVIIGVECAAWLVGKKGEHIKDLERQTGASIRLHEIRDAAALGLTSDGSSADNAAALRVVCVSGSPLSKYTFISLAVHQLEPRKGCIRLLVPTKVVPLMIGPKGATINSLTELCGAKIQIDRQEQGSVGGVVIGGISGGSSENNSTSSSSRREERIVTIQTENASARVNACVLLLEKLEMFDNPDFFREANFHIPLPHPTIRGLHSREPSSLPPPPFHSSSTSGGSEWWPSSYNRQMHPRLSAADGGREGGGGRDGDLTGGGGGSTEMFLFSQAQKYSTSRVIGPHAVTSALEVFFPRQPVDALRRLEDGGRSLLSRVAERSGCVLSFGPEPSPSAQARSLTFTGTALANSLALLLVQEKLMDLRF